MGLLIKNADSGALLFQKAQGMALGIWIFIAQGILMQLGRWVPAVIYAGSRSRSSHGAVIRLHLCLRKFILAAD